MRRLRSTVSRVCCARYTAVKEATKCPAAATPEPGYLTLVEKATSWAETLLQSPMKEQIISLKNAYRGKSQRPESLAAAAVVFKGIPDDVVPWLNESNAAAVLNGVSFFEVDLPQLPAVMEWTWDHIAGFDNSFSLVVAAQSLLQIDPDRDAAAERLRRDVVPVIRKQLPELHGDSFHIAVKLFQLLKLDDPAVWEEVCAGIRAREDAIAQRPMMAVRLFSCLARHVPDHELTAELFQFLLPSLNSMRSYDFTAMMIGTERWGKASFDDMLTVLARLGESTGYFNARDLGTAFPACVRATIAVERNGGLTAEQELKLAQHLNFAFDACELQVERFMNPQLPRFYWRKPHDIIVLLYAYESSGRCPSRIFDRFAVYCDAFADALSPRNVALALGMLRRTGRLSVGFATKVLPTIDKHTAELTFEEASHVALALASLDATPAIAASADAVRAHVASEWAAAEPNRFGYSETARFVAAANFAAAGRCKDAISGDVDLTKLPTRQLTDLLGSGMTSVVGAVRSELAARLAAGAVSPRDVVALAAAASGDAALKPPLRAAVERLLDAAEWAPAALDALRYSAKLDKACYAERAIAMAKSLAVSPQHFVAVADILVDALPMDGAVTAFLRASALDLRNNSFIHCIKFLPVAQRGDGLVSLEWFTDIVRSAVAKPKLLRASDVVRIAEYAPVAGWAAEDDAVAAMARRCVELSAEDALGAAAALDALTVLLPAAVPASVAADVAAAVATRAAAETAASAESAKAHKKERAKKAEKADKKEMGKKSSKAPKEKPKEKKVADHKEKSKEKKVADKKKASKK